jgi:hypothetical protein
MDYGANIAARLEGIAKLGAISLLAGGENVNGS